MPLEKLSKRKKWSIVAEMSIHNEEFYIDLQKLGLTLNQDEVFQQINYPAEALGLISIITGNDKNPGFRLCTKNMQLLHTC